MYLKTACGLFFIYCGLLWHRRSLLCNWINMSCTLSWWPLFRIWNTPWL